jgi:type I restriction enzyme S subunit
VSNAVASSVASRLWTETTLGEIADYITSGSRDWSRYYADSGAIFIRTQDINQNRLSLKDVAFVKLPQKVEGKRSLVRKGDLLITITGANVGKVAVVEREIPEAYVSQSVCLVRLKDPSVAKFIHLQLMAKRGDKTAVEAMAYGLGRPVLNLKNIRSAPIHIAPPKTQVLIVAEIEKQFSRLDEAVANLKRVKANLKRYKAAVLKAAVEGKLTEDWRKAHPNVEPSGKLLERTLAERRAKWNGRGRYKEPKGPDATILPGLPKEWEWATAEQLTDETRAITYGVIKLGPHMPDGIPVLRSSDVRSLYLDFHEVKRVAPEIAGQFKRTFLRGNEVLVTVRGTLGGVVVAPHQCAGFNISREVAMLVLVDEKIAQAMAIFIASGPIQRWLMQRTKGIA